MAKALALHPLIYGAVQTVVNGVNCHTFSREHPVLA
jgi:hypothetical protein